MTPATFDVLVVLFAYSGNGGVASTIPQLMMWFAPTFHKMKTDPRIGRVGTLVLCDTPITMTRNQALAAARDGGFDFLLMLDSDNEPDGALDRDPSAKPFWDVAFDLAYKRKVAGKETIIAAPYCGPPPSPEHFENGEVPYLFQWENNESDVEQPGFKLRLISRHEAALMRGIHRVAALPTGCCLLSIGVINGMKPPFFHYEFDKEHAHKNSTEDVVFTRNASLHWQLKGGDNICFAACDSWAYHHKTKVVGRPTIMPVEMIADDFRQAVLRGDNAGDMVIDVNQEIPGNLLHVKQPTQQTASPTASPAIEPAPLRQSAQVSDPVEDAIPGSPIIHRNVGGQIVTTDQRWPLTEPDAAAIMKLIDSIEEEAPRILALNAGLGDNLSVLTQAAAMRNQSATFASARGIDRDSYIKNMDAAGLPDAKCPLVDPEPEDLDNQALDLLWVGHPSDPDETLDQIAKWLPHVKINGLVAGIGLAVNQSVARVVQAFVENLELIDGSSVWFTRNTIDQIEDHGHD